MTGRSRPRWHRRPAWDVYLVVAAGGAVGGFARWAVGAVLPGAPGAIPWGTFLINVSGSFLLGALMVCVLDVWRPGRYLRPFCAVGVLGGYTTFSTYTVQARDLLAAGEPARAFCYTVGSLAAGLVAVSAGVVLARVLAGHPVGGTTRGDSRGGLAGQAAGRTRGKAAGRTPGEVIGEGLAAAEPPQAYRRTGSSRPADGTR